MSRLRRRYGAQPLHLLIAALSFELIGAGVAGWLHAGSDTRNTLFWALGCLAVPQLVLVVVAWLIDRAGLRRRVRRADGRVPDGAARTYLSVPALLSGLLGLVSLPLILRYGSDTFQASSGVSPSNYLARWLLVTAGLFSCSALLYAFRLAQARRARAQAR